MALHTLFIGIDRHASPKISDLTCAARDAIALEALFSDTLGGTAKLLVDKKATRNAIKEGFDYLATTKRSDVVVIGFSGHGSETHELITHDTKPTNLKATSIPLDVLTDWFSRIPARRLILFLDCCFSGGVASKVLHVDARPRDMRSTESILDELSGEGRLILTASGPEEPAYEKARVGHGLMTYYLLEALQGVEEVRTVGKISVYQLLDFVTRRVTDAAIQFGEVQRPALRGRIDGELTWPIFKPGDKYRAAFPDRDAPEVTADLQSLAAHGFPQQVIDAWAQAIPSLNRLQLDAINEYKILDGDHLVVSAPTSSGKTMIGEIAAIKGALQRKKALFLLPLKALVYDKQRYFDEVYGDFGIRTLDATGESDDIGPLLRGKYDICLLTYEKFAAVVLGNPHILDQVSTVVDDEVQMIADNSRGKNLEFLLTLLRMRRRQRIEPQLIALSAVIGHTNGLERWLDARLLRRDERPVPLDEGLLLGNGAFRYLSAETGKEETEQNFIQPIWSGKNSSQDYVIPLVQKLVREGQQVIVFREQKGYTRGCAKYLARDLDLPAAQDALTELPAGDLSLASQELRIALEGGVAFHNADLDREERRVIEELFRAKDSSIRVIVATTTLAMGVNTPAESVVIVGLTHPFSGPYSVAEYKNLVGRAGRLGFSKKGYAFLLATDGRSEYDYWRQYVSGEPEDLVSRFLEEYTDPRTQILKVIVAMRGHSARGSEGAVAKDVIDFLEASFGAFQRKHQADAWQWSRDELQRNLTEIEEYKLIERSKSQRYHITELGELAGEGGSEVVSIIRLVACLDGIPAEQINDPTLIAATQMTVELDDVLFPINKSSTKKEPAAWPYELRNQGVNPSVLSSLRHSTRNQVQGTLRAKKAVACLLYVSTMPMNEIEGILTRFGRREGAAGPIRSTAERTCDLLPSAARVAEILHPGLDLSERQGKLVGRLTHGVTAKMSQIAVLCGRDLNRADYLSLEGIGVTDADAIESCDKEQLLEALGGSKPKRDSVLNAAKRMREEERQAEEIVTPILAPYEG